MQITHAPHSFSSASLLPLPVAADKHAGDIDKAAQLLWLFAERQYRSGVVQRGSF
jgi:hypothetical protein